MAASIGNMNLKLSVDAMGLISGLNQAGQAVKGFAGATASMVGGPLGRISSIAAGVGAALGGVGSGLGIASAVRVGADFEQSMARVRALTNATGEEFQALGKLAEQLGAATEFSASQAAEGMSSLAQAGFKVGDILAAMEPTLALASTGQIEIGEAADITAKIMAGMGIKASKLTETVDVLAAAMTNCNTNMSQLGEAMRYVGPVAKFSGKSLEEVTAAIMMLSNAGLQGEMAGSTLRNILLKASDRTEDAKQMMMQYGLSFEDAAGNALHLSAVVDQLQQKLGGLGKGRQLEVLSTLFEARAATGMATLLEQGGDKLREFEQRLRSSAGKANEIRGIQQDTVKRQFDEFTSALEGTNIAASKLMSGPLREALAFLTEGANQLTVVVKQFQFEGTFKGVGDVLSRTFEGVGLMAQVLTSNLSKMFSVGVGLFSNMSGDWSPGVSNLSAGFKGLSEEIAGFNTQADTVGGRIAKFLEGVGVGLAYVLDLAKFITGAFDKLGGKFVQLTAVIPMAVARMYGALSYLPGWLGQTAAALENIMNRITGDVLKVGKALENTGDQLMAMRIGGSADAVHKFFDGIRQGTAQAAEDESRYAKVRGDLWGKARDSVKGISSQIQGLTGAVGIGFTQLLEESAMDAAAAFTAITGAAGAAAFMVEGVGEKGKKEVDKMADAMKSLKKLETPDLITRGSAEAHKFLTSLSAPMIEVKEDQQKGLIAEQKNANKLLAKIEKNTGQRPIVIDRIG